MKRRILKMVAFVLAVSLWMQAPMTQAAEKIGILNADAFMLDDNEECQIYRVYAYSYHKRNCYQIPDTVYMQYDANGKEFEPKGIQCQVDVLGMPEQNVNGMDYRSKNAVYFNLFGRMIEPWEDYVAPAGDPLTRDGMKVHTIYTPYSVRRFEPAVFARMTDLKTIYLPRNLGSLEKFAFLDCENLEEIVFPDSIEIKDSTVFMGCKKLKGLEKRTKSIKEPLTISYENDLVMDFDKKTLIQVTPTAEQITIPAEVKEIEPLAFAGCHLKTVKVEKGNKTFAVHGRCLYNKKNGKLVLAFGKGSKLTLSKRIKRIDKDSMAAAYKLKKLVMPKKLKRSSGWKNSFVANNNNIKIYYRGKRIR